MLPDMIIDQLSIVLEPSESTLQPAQIDVFGGMSEGDLIKLTEVEVQDHSSNVILLERQEKVRETHLSLF